METPKYTALREQIAKHQKIIEKIRTERINLKEKIKELDCEENHITHIISSLIESYCDSNEKK